MRRSSRAFLMRGFEAIGPDCVRRGLQATGHGWSSCFVVRAPGPLPQEAMPIPTRTLGAGPFYGAWLGIASGWVYQVALLWDRDEAESRAVAQEWLGAHEATRGPGVAATGPGHVETGEGSRHVEVIL